MISIHSILRVPRRAALFAPLLLLLCAGARADVKDHGGEAEPFAQQNVNAVDSIQYRQVVTSNNLMGVTLTNYGFIGNNFISRASSLEFPAGSGYEHMVRGGIWIGAHVTNGTAEFDDVVTGTTDGATSNASQGATEFTPADKEFQRRSNLLTDPFYSTSAISEQDIIGTYSDFPAKRAASNQEDHRPMGLVVTQENYSWSFSDFANILFFHIKVKNTGPTLTNLWVAWYSEFASGNKGAYTNWAPSSADPSGTGSWFNKKQIVYDDSLRLFREHYCASLPFPDGCSYPRAPYWIGVRALGSKGLYEDTTTRKVTVAAWSWAPSSPYRAFDAQRFKIMSAGTVQPLTGDSLLPQSGDPVELVSVGPFPRLYSDSTISVDFAVVGGGSIQSIQQTSRVAQRAFDLQYILPEPPPSPRLHLVSRDQALDLYWDNSPESTVDPTSPILHDFEGYRLYLGESRNDLKRVASFDSNLPPGDTTGFNTGFSAVKLNSPVNFNGVDYHYRYTINGLKNGFKYYAAITSYDIGSNIIESLESGQTQNLALGVPGPAAGEHSGTGPIVFPNPYRVEARWDQGQKIRDHYLWFTQLPRRCTLKILTLSGDLILEQQFDGSTYNGSNARGLYSPQRDAPLGAPSLSGTSFAWNLITREGEPVATGLYLFTVEDKDTGKRTVGKFLIVKSDRE